MATDKGVATVMDTLTILMMSLVIHGKGAGKRAKVLLLTIALLWLVGFLS